MTVPDSFYNRHATVQARLESILDDIGDSEKGTVAGNQLEAVQNHIALSNFYAHNCDYYQESEPEVAMEALALALSSLGLAERVLGEATVSLMKPTVEMGMATSAAQSKRASNARTPQEITYIINRLAIRAGTAKMLWPAFVGDLDAAGLAPVEEGLVVHYESDAGPGRMSFKTFSNKLSTARN